MSGFPPDQQRRLLDLQDLDSRADVLDQQWRSHPALQALIDLGERADALQTSLAAADEAVEQAKGRVRASEREADDIKRRQAKDQTRLDAGSVSSPRELEKLQHEIATLQGKLDEVETVELEAMEDLDNDEEQAAGLRADLAAVAADREKHEADLDTARGAIDAEREALSADRAEVLAGLDEALVARYERARSSHGGVGVGALRHGRCEGCRLSLTPADLARFAAAPPDELLFCEECGRLLVRVDDE
jgi:predicted  nucleic acid-binding Zn-ribbon protein